MLAAATRDMRLSDDSIYQKFSEIKEGRHKSITDLCHPYIYECYNIADKKCNINVAAMEQSNGYSLLGGVPKDNFSLGE